MDVHTLILIGVFVYFAVGALYAGALTILSMGFAGRFEPTAILLLFAWPFMLAMKIPAVAFVFVVLTFAGFITWLASLALHFF